MKVDEARAVLATLGFDAERSNERSAMALLALLGLTETDDWADAQSPLLGTRAIMDWIRDEYGVEYAPNTRETIRRFTLHQFADSLLVEQNPDQPDRPVNSPRWCYGVHPLALDVIRTYGTPAWDAEVAEYLRQRPGLVSTYAAAREMDRIPVTLPGGKPLTLSPGGQNVLIKAMSEDFWGISRRAGQCCTWVTPTGSGPISRSKHSPTLGSRSTPTARCPTSWCTSPTASGLSSWKPRPPTARSIPNVTGNSPPCSPGRQRASCTSPLSPQGPL